MSNEKKELKILSFLLTLKRKLNILLLREY